MAKRIPEPGENTHDAARAVGLPPRPFLYTIDQVCTLLNVTENDLRIHHVYYEGRSTGNASRELMTARNIAPRDASPDWRIAEAELIRWMRRKGFRYYDRASIRG